MMKTPRWQLTQAGYVCALLVLSACKGPEVFERDVPYEGQQSIPCFDDVPEPTSRGSSGETFVYVMSALVVDETPSDANTPQHGFNLDGIHTADDGSTPRSCGKPDQPSLYDPEENCPSMLLSSSGRCHPSCLLGCRGGTGCRGGVDNQLPNLLDAVGTALAMRFPDGIRPAIREMVLNGEHPLIVVVRGVDSFESDDGVEVSVYDAVQNFSAMCSAVLPDREYAIRRGSVMGREPQRSVYAPLYGSIRGGRLRTTGGTFPFYMPTTNGSGAYRFEIAAARLSIDLSPDGGGRGNVGGYVPAVAMVPYGPFVGVSESETEGIVGGFVDLQEPIPTAATTMGGTCVNRMQIPTRFGNVGVGFGITIVRARLAPDLVDARAPGACGTPILDAGITDGGDASRRTDVPNPRDVARTADASLDADTPLDATVDASESSNDVR